MRGTDRDALRRGMLDTIRGTFVKADDSKKMQTVQLRGMFGEEWKDIEHWHPYGFTMANVAPKQQGGGAGGGGSTGEGGREQPTGEEPELLILRAGGSASHPVALPTADRRYRMRDLEPGEAGLHDDQHQRVHITRDLIDTVSPKKLVARTIMSGSGGAGGGGSAMLFGAGAGGSGTSGASTKQTRQQEKTRTTVTQTPDGKVVISSHDSSGTVKTSVTVENDNVTVVADKNVNITAKAEKVSVKSESSDITVTPGSGKFVYLGGDGSSGTYGKVQTDAGTSVNVKAKVG